MSLTDKSKHGEVESEDEELSENEEKNLENILVLFPKRKPRKNLNTVDDNTFDKVKNLLKCPVCLEIYKDPVFIKECMHRFCKQCIERIIRSQQNKGCPFCRLPLGSKRVLRNDYFTENISTQNSVLNKRKIVSKIIPNLSEYLEREEKQEIKYFNVKIREMQETNKQNRKKKDIERSYEKLELASNQIHKKNNSVVNKIVLENEKYDKGGKSKSINEEDQTDPFIRKKKKTKQYLGQINQMADNRPIMSDEIADSFAINEVSCPILDAKSILFDELRNSLSLRNALIEVLQLDDLKSLVIKQDLLTPFSVEPLPSDSYLKYFDNQLIKTSSSITISQITKYLCSLLNLDETSYIENISMWAKKDGEVDDLFYQKRQFEKLENNLTIKNIISKYWSQSGSNDLEIFDSLLALNDLLNKETRLSHVHKRTLYYNIDFSKFLIL